MRDVHIALRELQAAEARLFELVESAARQEIAELAIEVERDPAIVTESELRLEDGNR